MSDARPSNSSDPSLLMVLTSTQRRGGELLGASTAHGLAARGWQVEVRALVSSPPPAIEVVALHSGTRSRFLSVDPRVLFRLRRVVRSQRPDVVYAYGGATLMLSVLATAMTSARVVYRSIGEPMFWARGRLARRRLGWFLRRCALVVAVSEPTRTQIVQGLGVPGGRVVVSHPGVDARLLTVPSSEGGGDVRLLFLGSLSPEKDPERALDNVATAVADTTATLRFVGGGPLSEVLAARARGIGSGLNVELVGAVTDVVPHLEWADVLVVTSKTEGLPGAVLEAAAAAVPTVAFDVGGMSDAVIDGETGRLVPPRDDAAFVQAVAALVADRSLCRSMGDAARRHVTASFLMEPALDRSDSILRTVLDGAHSGGST